jgi:hypothetical protein
MPPFVPLTDGAQLELRYSYPDTLVIENRLWFISRQPPVTSAQLLALAGGAAAWVVAQLLPLLSSDITFLSSVATDWSGSAPGAIEQVAINLTGGDFSGIHSANVSYRVRFRGTSAQPRLINSNFVGGIPRGAVVTNTVEGTFKDALFDAYVNVIDLAPLWGPFPAWRWVITSAIDGGSYRTEQLASRTDFIQTPSPFISPRRRRITRLRKL